MQRLEKTQLREKEKNLRRKEDKNLRRREGDRERGRGSWIGDASWCRDGGVATDERRGGVAS